MLSLTRAEELRRLGAAETEGGDGEGAGSDLGLGGGGEEGAGGAEGAEEGDHGGYLGDEWWGGRMVQESRR